MANLIGIFLVGVPCIVILWYLSMRVEETIELLVGHNQTLRQDLEATRLLLEKNRITNDNKYRYLVEYCDETKKEVDRCKDLASKSNYESF